MLKQIAVFLVIVLTPITLGNATLKHLRPYKPMPNFEYQDLIDKKMNWGQHSWILERVKDDEYLSVIAFLESSNGKLMEHKIVRRGLNKGTAAIGFFGLMPLTIKDLVTRYKTLKTKYGHLINDNTSLDDIPGIVYYNPQLYLDVALFYKRLIFKYIDCHKRRVFAWKYGIEGAINAAEDKVSQDEYVVRFFDYKGRKKQRKYAEADVNEALARSLHPLQGGDELLLDKYQFSE